MFPRVHSAWCVDIGLQGSKGMSGGGPGGDERLVRRQWGWGEAAARVKMCRRNAGEPGAKRTQRRHLGLCLERPSGWVVVSLVA